MTQDPWNWTAQDVVNQITGTPSILERLNHRPLVRGTKVIFDSQVQKRNIHGAILLGQDDIKSFLHTLGVFRSAEVVALTDAVANLRSLSSQYKRLHRRTEGESVNGGAAIAPSNTSHNANYPAPTGSLPSANGVIKPRRVVLENNAPVPADSADFGAAPMLVSDEGLTSEQLEGLLERWPEEDQESISQQSEHADDVDMDAEETDDAVSDTEPREEDALLPIESTPILRRGRYYSRDQVLDMIHDWIEEYSKTWGPGVAEEETRSEDSIDAAAFDPYILWHDFQSFPATKQKELLDTTKANIEALEEKVNKNIDGIMAHDWGSQKAIFRQCYSLQSSLDNLYQEQWELDIYEKKSPPPNTSDSEYEPLMNAEEPNAAATHLPLLLPAMSRATPSTTATRHLVLEAGALATSQRQPLATATANLTVSRPPEVRYQGESDRIYLVPNKPVPTASHGPSSGLGSQRERPIVIDLGSDDDDSDAPASNMVYREPMSCLPVVSSIHSGPSVVADQPNQPSSVGPLEGGLGSMIIDSIEQSSSRPQRPSESVRQTQSIPMRPSLSTTRRTQLPGPPNPPAPRGPAASPPSSMARNPALQSTQDRRPPATEPPPKKARRVRPAPVLIPPSTAPAALTRPANTRLTSNSLSTPSPPTLTVNLNLPTDIASYRTVTTWSWDELIHTTDRKRIIQKIVQEMQPDDRERLRERINLVQKHNLMREITACVQAMARGDVYDATQQHNRFNRRVPTDAEEVPSVRILGYLPRDIAKIERMTRLFVSWWLAGDYYNAFYHAAYAPRKEAAREQLSVLDAGLQGGAPDLGAFLDWVHYIMQNTFSERALKRLWDPSEGEIIVID